MGCGHGDYEGRNSMNSKKIGWHLYTYVNSKFNQNPFIRN